MNNFLNMVGVSLVTLAAASVAPGVAHAQEQLASATTSVADEIIVTGRAGTGDLRKLEASFAITTLDADALRLDRPASVADVFKNIPGFWVESSGGEASNNIRVRGIPRDGYSSIGLFEDGLPVQHDPGLGFLNADQSFRFDETHLRVEAVRGGPSSIFASNAPGGLVNFITRRGGDTLQVIAKAEVGDWGSYRGDAFIGVPLSEDWSLGVGGFYRSDDGLRNTQFVANRGGQIRANLSGRVGPGSVFIDVKHIDDNVAFFLPVPLTFDGSGNVTSVRGFDALQDTFAGRPTENLIFRNVGGDQPFDLSRGTDVKLTQVTAKFELELGNDFNLSNGFRYRTSETTRNGLFPANVNLATNRLASVRGSLLAAVPGATNVVLRYADDGSAYDTAGTSGNGLVSDATVSTVDIPLDEIINDFRLTRKFSFGNQSHDVAVGVYYAGFDVGFRRFGSTILLEAANNARPLDIVAVNAAGQALFTATEAGFTRHGSQFNNASNSSDVWAIYGSDEWSIGDQFRIDFGARWERLAFRGRVERQRTVNLGVPTTTADDQVITGTGVFDSFAQKFDDFGYTIGGNFQPDRNLGFFARYTKTFRLPNATDFLGSAVRTDLVKEDIDLAEAGAKYASPLLDLFVTGFYTYFKGVRFTSNEFVPATGGFIQRTEFADAKTWGLEAEGMLRPAPFFDVGFVLTYQKPEFRNFTFTENVGGAPVQRDFSGNNLLRVPEFSFRIVPGVNLFDDKLRVQARVEYFSDRFADAANSVTLPSYWLLGASARLAVTEKVSLFVIGDNLTNSIGLTEGNPRAGQFASGDAGAQFYLARPVFGRNFRASVLVEF